MTEDSIAMCVNRAVLHYNNGAYDLALADMDDVIARDPRKSCSLRKPSGDLSGD